MKNISAFTRDVILVSGFRVLQFFKDRHYLDKEWGHHFSSVSAHESDLVLLIESVDSNFFIFLFVGRRKNGGFGGMYSHAYASVYHC